jgi:hypothetical protein
VVEENLAVEVRLGEAVGARIELLVILLRLEAERIEIGVKVAAHPVGADQHQGADRIARRLLQLFRCRALASGRRLRRAGLQFGADGFLDLRPVAIERRGQIVAWRLRPIRPFPGRPLRVAADFRRRVLQALEELLPLGIDGGRVLLVAGVEIVDIGGVGAVEKRGKGESGIRILARHIRVLI